MLIQRWMRAIHNRYLGKGYKPQVSINIKSIGAEQYLKRHINMMSGECYKVERE